MNIHAIRTEKIIPFRQNIFAVLDHSLHDFRERSILVVTSKIVSICEGSVVNKSAINKQALIKREADYIFPAKKQKYNIVLTIKNNFLIPTAGIDESNVKGYYVLWPRNPQKSADSIRKYLCERFHVQYAGVIITDSKTTPLRWGTTGVAIAHSGFMALRNYIGKPDIFKRKLKVTKANVMDALAAAAVVVMGEGKEQTPLAVIEDIPFVVFQKRDPTKKELDALKIRMADDLYAPLLKGAWEKKKTRSRL